jgi:hypothetical protein
VAAKEIAVKKYVVRLSADHAYEVIETAAVAAIPPSVPDAPASTVGAWRPGRSSREEMGGVRAALMLGVGVQARTT